MTQLVNALLDCLRVFDINALCLGHSRVLGRTTDGRQAGLNVTLFTRRDLGHLFGLAYGAVVKPKHVGGRVLLTGQGFDRLHHVDGGVHGLAIIDGVESYRLKTGVFGCV